MEGITYQQAGRKRAYFEEDDDPIFVARRTTGAATVTERRYFDSELSGRVILSNSSWTGAECDPAALNTIFAPTRGDDIANRDGRKLTILKTTIRGVIRGVAKSSAALPLNPCTIRLILYVDKQTNGVQAASTLLMANPVIPTSQVVPTTFQNTDNFGRFQVLKDKTYTLQNPLMFVGAGGIYVENSVGLHFKISYKWKKGLPVRFDSDNNGTVADIVDNSLHIIAAASDDFMTPTMWYTARTVFMDA
nr:MAG TPA: capsid protein [Cressdnaviricota sp.]